MAMFFKNSYNSDTYCETCKETRQCARQFAAKMGESHSRKNKGSRKNKKPRAKTINLERINHDPQKLTT